MGSVDVTQIVGDYIHEGKQFATDKKSAVLTVKSISRIIDGGALDFGGSEYGEAEVSRLQPEKRNSEDKYGWWQLSPGQYRVELNERIYPSEGTQLMLHPWSHAVAAGVTHPVELISGERSPLFTHITVGPQGLAVKENARISQVTILG